MTTAFLYIFIFSTWGLGLLSWVVGLSHSLRKWELEDEEKTLEIEQKRQFFNRLSSLASKSPAMALGSQTVKDIPEKIKELMSSSPNHPEVEEIDGSDQILGVRFEAENYPPGFGGDVGDE
jgi:hypothetical protein